MTGSSPETSLLPESEQNTDTEVTDTSQDENSTADTSAADDIDDKEPENSLDAINKALDENKGEGSSSSKTSQENDEDSPETSEEDDEGDDLPDEVTEEELSSYKPKTAARMRKILGDNKSLQEKVDKYENTVQQQERMETFLRESDVTPQDFHNGLKIMGLMRTNPAQALELLKPYVQDLETVTGEVLPADLQEKVRLGYLSAEDARELSRARSGSQLTAQQLERERQLNAERQKQKDAETLQGNVSSAITTLENQWSQSDPDYKLKQPRVMEKVKLAFLTGNRIKSVDEAVALANKAKAEVDQEMKMYLPQKKPVTNVDGVSSSSKPVEPKNTLDVINQALGG